MSKQGVFNCDPNFCGSCGAILPLPDQSDIIKCKVCSTVMNIELLEDVEIYTSKDYNQDKNKSREEMAHLKSISEEAEDGGPVVRRRCVKCGHKKMTYITRQTRSVDEGQTVFYTCIKCHATETEYS